VSAFSNQNVQVWANPSTDSRALLKPGFTNRISSAWTTTTNQGASFTIDLNLSTNTTHQVALYCMDWLGTGTLLEKIEVFDYADLSHALDVRNLQLPPNGVYLIWNLAGHKILRVTKQDANASNKALVSAIFFGGGS